MTQKPHILVVEDEPTILDNLLYSLETEGFEPHGCSTGAEALALLETRPDVALAVLDIGLPDTTGFELCKAVRATRALPLIFLTARASELDRVLGLELGADDYVVKPFSPRELCARGKAVLRRCGDKAPAGPAPPETSPPPPPLAIDALRKRASYFGTPLALSSTEYKILAALARQPGRVFSRAQLMEAAWEEPEAAMERTVDTHIKSIRSKLESAHPGADPLITHRGLGYSLREDWP